MCGGLQDFSAGWCYQDDCRTLVPVGVTNLTKAPSHGAPEHSHVEAL
jgi:hypothetical protein